MASASLVTPYASVTQERVHLRSATFFINPSPLRPSKAVGFPVKPKSRAGLQVRASFKEKAVTGLTAASLTASMLIPEVAEAAGPGVSPSLKNFLLSIAAGGVVLGAILGAVIAVSNFDPVKRS